MVLTSVCGLKTLAMVSNALAAESPWLLPLSPVPLVETSEAVEVVVVVRASDVASFLPIVANVVTTLASVLRSVSK